MPLTIAELLAAQKKAVEAKAASQAGGAGASVSEATQAGKEGDSAAAEAAKVAAETAAKEGEAKDGKEGGAKDGKEAKVEGAQVDTPAAAAPDLSALVQKVTALSIENAQITAAHDSLMASCAALATIAGDSLSRMSIALGGGKVDVSNMTPESLVAQHTATAAQFAAKFPTNGIAAVAGAGTEEAKQDLKVDPLHAQRMAAVMGQNRKD